MVFTRKSRVPNGSCTIFCACTSTALPELGVELVELTDEVVSACLCISRNIG
jgi:hypothetical protein